MKFLKRFNEELDKGTYRSAADKIEAGEGVERGDSRVDRAKALRKHADIVESKILLYYAFDWDDNILNMPTEIMVLDKDGGEVGMSTSDFAINRSKIGNEEFEYKGRVIVGIDYATAFINFRDEADPEIFKKDVVKAIEFGSYAPAWDKFIKCLTTGAVFAIITARGHEPEGIRKGIEYIIDNILSEDQKQVMYSHLLRFANLFKVEGADSLPRILRGVASENELVVRYLDLCHLVGVSAPSRGGSPKNPEAAKEEALMDFITDANDYASRIGYTAEVGFSDDDPGNVSHVTHALSSKDLNHEKLWPFISRILIINTNKPKDVVRTEIPTRDTVKTFDEFKKESMDPMASSTMSMQTPNAAMSAGMNSKDPFITRGIGQSKLLAKTSRNVFDKNKKKD